MISSDNQKNRSDQLSRGTISKQGPSSLIGSPQGRSAYPPLLPEQSPILISNAASGDDSIAPQTTDENVPAKKAVVISSQTSSAEEDVLKNGSLVQSEVLAEPEKETPGKVGALPKTASTLHVQEAREALIEDLLELDQAENREEDDEGLPTLPASPIATSSVENVILYRGQHFYVRTTIRPDKRRNADPLRKPSGHTAMVPKIVPSQKDRVAASETRLMPAIDVQDFTPRKRHLRVPAWFEVASVTFGVILSVILHAWNMFNYPRYEMDEGTYMSAAWAILNNKLYPYPYGYGHPPFGWMQLAALVKFAGGFFLFGNAVDTGRVLMLSYTLGSTLLIYLIARKMSGSRAMALLSLAIFAFSPLAIDYQRLVLLDNIATFWFLLSLYFLLISRSQLRYTILSAICLGLAFLSKEVLLLFMPAMVYGTWLYTSPFQRKFALVAFIYSFMAICSLYVLLAVLKGELIPPVSWIPWDKNPHLSLLDTFLGQTKRGQSEGSLLLGWKAWYGLDPVLMLLGIIAIAFNLVVGWWKRNHLFLALLGMSYWLLLVRGGVVFPFYFIPLIPMMALNSTMMIHTLADWAGRFVRLDLLRTILLFCVLGLVLVFDATNSGLAYKGNATSVQNQAIAWVRTNIPRDSYIVMNSYMYMDLRASGGAAVGNGSVFSNAEVYINIANDPVLIAETGGNWDRVDYIVADSQIEDYLTGSQLPLGAKFLKTALYAAGYPNSPCATFSIPGYRMRVWCVKHQNPSPIASVPTPIENRAQLG